MDATIYRLSEVPHLCHAVAVAITAHNRLRDPTSTREVHNHSCFYSVALLGDDSLTAKLVGCVRVERVQWYQAEVRHLCVLPEYRRQGHARRLLRHAFETARTEYGAQLAQMTIRSDNAAMLDLASQCGAQLSAGFRSGSHAIWVYHAELSGGL